MTKIVFIENTGMVRIKFEKTMAKYGYTDVVAIEGYHVFTDQGALKIVDPNIIFVDSDNRETKIDKMLKDLRDKYGNNVFIVTMTSKADVSEIKKLYLLRTDDILAKPYTEVQLMEKIFKVTDQPTMINVGDDQDFQQDNERYMPKWNADLVLGIESIDSEHKALIEHYETLYQKMRTGGGHEYCIELVHYLEDYVKQHFEHEEAFHEQISYDDIIEHRQSHLKFTEQVKEMAEELEGKEVTNKDLVRFNLFIKNWWLHHILVEDRKYMDFYRENKTED